MSPGNPGSARPARRAVTKRWAISRAELVMSPLHSSDNRPRAAIRCTHAARAGVSPKRPDGPPFPPPRDLEPRLCKGLTDTGVIDNLGRAGRDDKKLEP